MIILEERFNEEDEWQQGYFLNIEQLAKLVRDFQADCLDGFVSNDESYIENWLKNNK